jgi:thiamine pyrophosphate-dependent acetolactate synthase large subunit-like protein
MTTFMTKDVILVFGCRFSDLHTASWQPGFAYNIPATKLIQVDIDPGEIARNYPVDMGIVGDIKTVITQLIGKAEVDGAKGRRYQSRQSSRLTGSFFNGPPSPHSNTKLQSWLLRYIIDLGSKGDTLPEGMSLRGPSCTQ